MIRILDSLGSFGEEGADCGGVVLAGSGEELDDFGGVGADTESPLVV